MAGQTVIISVLADTKKFSTAMKNLSRETGLSKLGDGFKNVGRKVTNFFKNGIKLSAAFVTAMAGLAIKGGFDRMLKIESAEAKLKGLGRTTEEIEGAMDSALKSVKGTSFGLDSAATAAASAMAAGIKPGQELEKYLKGIADASTIAGVGMDEMGSIFGKIATSGRAQTTEINQIADRGIPIWAALADQYGVNQAELRKMVSAGKVDAETFYNTMDTLVGGAAQEAGNTTIGAWANMKAAASRAGAALITDVFPQFKTVFQGITGWLDGLTDKIKPVGVAFGAWVTSTAVPAVKALFSWVGEKLMPVLRSLWETLSGAVRTAIATVATALKDAGGAAGDMGSSIGDKLLAALTFLAPVLARIIIATGDLVAWLIRSRDVLIPVAVAIVTLVTAWAGFNKVMRIAAAVQAAFNVAMSLNPIGLIIAAVAALVAGLAWFFTQTETGQAVVTAAWAAIQTAVQVVVDWWQTTVAPVITSVWTAITDAATVAADWYTTNIAPVFAAFATLVGAIFARIGSVVGWLWSKVWKPTIDLILAYWSLLWALVKAAWAAIGPPLIATITGAWTTFSGIIEGVWKTIAGIFTGVWTGIRITIETVLGVIKGAIQTATAIIKGDWSGAWNSIKDTFALVWDGLLAALGNYITTLTTTISNIKNTVTGAFSNAGTWLKDAGRAVVQGFVDGISAMFGAVKDKLGSLTDKLTSWKGPPERDKTILRNAGRIVIGGFVNGLQDKFGAAKKSLRGFTKDLAKTDMGKVKLNGGVALSVDSTLAKGARAGLVARANVNPAPVTYNVTVQALAPNAEVGRAVVAAIRDFERMNGASR